VQGSELYRELPRREGDLFTKKKGRREKKTRRGVRQRELRSPEGGFTHHKKMPARPGREDSSCLQG